MGNRTNYEVLVKIVCSNETIESVDCVDFAMKIEGKLELEFKNLVFYFNISNVVVKDTVIRRDHLGLNDTSFE